MCPYLFHFRSSGPQLALRIPDVGPLDTEDAHCPTLSRIRDLSIRGAGRDPPWAQILHSVSIRTLHVATWARFCGGPLRLRDGRGWATLPWEDIPAGEQGTGRKSLSGNICISKSASCWAALPSNKVISFKAKRLSSEAKFYCSSYFSLGETK